MKLNKFKLDKFIDKKGSLIKAVNHSYVGRRIFGEIYTIFFNARSVRANHYHKKSTEWFIVIKGRVNMYLKHIKTEEKRLIKLDGNKPICIRVDPLVAHALKPVNDKEAILIAYSNKKYDRDKSDTYKYEVIKEKIN